VHVPLRVRIGLLEMGKGQVQMVSNRLDSQRRMKLRQIKKEGF